MDIENRINNCREHIGELLEYVNARKEDYRQREIYLRILK